MSDTYVIPDIHGRYDLLLMALGMIRSEALGGTIVFLGDYIDRGPNSMDVITTLMAGPQMSFGKGSEHWAWICLKGNHEAMMVDAVTGFVHPNNWIDNGGETTIKSYCVAMTKLSMENIPQSHIHWCDSLPLYYKDKHRIYVHGCVDPSKPMNHQSEDTLIWGRVPKMFNYTHPEGHVVHGHTPYLTGPILLEGRTNLDTGAYGTGKLHIGVFRDDTPGGPVRILHT